MLVVVWWLCRTVNLDGNQIGGTLPAYVSSASLQYVALPALTEDFPVRRAVCARFTVQRALCLGRTVSISGNSVTGTLPNFYSMSAIRCECIQGCHGIVLSVVV